MPKDVESILNELVRRANENSRRIRALEERNMLIETRVGNMEGAILRNAELAKTKLEELNEKLDNFSSQLLKIENDVSKINKTLEKTAKKTELAELENMLSLFNPLRSKFITKEDVLKLIGKG